MRILGLDIEPNDWPFIKSEGLEYYLNMLLWVREQEQSRIWSDKIRTE